MKIGKLRDNPDANRLGGSLKSVIDEIYGGTATESAVRKMMKARHRLEWPELWAALDEMSEAAFDAVDNWIDPR